MQTTIHCSLHSCDWPFTIKALFPELREMENPVAPLRLSWRSTTSSLSGYVSQKQYYHPDFSFISIHAQMVLVKGDK